MTYWYLSFVDKHRPAGDRFVGAAIVKADSMEHAMKVTWEKGINPGGEIMGFEILPHYEHIVFQHNLIDRLLSREELEAVDRAHMQ